MSCHNCYIDQPNRRHLPLTCDRAGCDAPMGFLCAIGCQDQCGHFLVPVCASGHLSKPKCTRHCPNAKNMLNTY